ncbi:MAG: hypothetical protein AAF367_03345 [Pseudomonadota bacterium]
MMNVVEDGPERLILRTRISLVGLALAAGALFGLWRVALHPGDFDDAVTRALAGIAFAALLGGAWWAFPRATLLLDRAEAIAVISEQRIGHRLTRAFPLAELEGVRVLNTSRRGRTLSPFLVVSGMRHPILRYGRAGEGAYEVQRVVEEWLTA